MREEKTMCSFPCGRGEDHVCRGEGCLATVMSRDDVAQKGKRLSFAEAVGMARRNLDIACFPARDRRIAEELCRVLAEVLMMPEEGRMRIAGEDLPARMVKDVMAMVRHEHAEMVIENFREQRGKIFNIKAYFRTALYNAAFELDSHYENEVRAGMGGVR